MKTLSGAGRYAGIALAVTCLSLSAPAQNLQLISGLNQATTAPAGGDGYSGAPIISPDGRYILFASTADNLLLATNNAPIPARIPAPLNVFLRDRANGTNCLVSVNASGVAGGNGDSVPVNISTNGRYAVFESSASDLVAGDTNNATDVFVRDLMNGSTILVSVNTNGVAGNGASRSAAMTSDGRYVAFVSAASNLVPRDTNGIPDVFVRDLQLGVTTMVSTQAVARFNTTSPIQTAEIPEISADGRYVAFYSTATNLVPGVGRGSDIYVRDLVTGTTTWASAYARTALATNFVLSYNHAMSADGNFVAYEASMSNAPAGIVLRYDLETGLTDVVHTNAAVPSGMPEDIASLAMTPDGRFIAFLANTDATNTTCVLLWDATTGNTQLVSGDPSGNVPTNSICSWPALDSSGRFVTFLSSSTNLVPGATVTDYHLYLRDVQSATTRVVDSDPSGGSLVSASCNPQLSADGASIAFTCADGALVPNDNNRELDAFVQDVATGTNALVSQRLDSLGSSTPNGASTLGLNSLSADGRYLAFASEAVNLVANDLNGCRDVFLRDLSTGQNTLVSVSTNGTGGDAPSSQAAISPDGRFVVFTSSADNLVDGDTNRLTDVLLLDLKTKVTELISANTNSTGSGNNASHSPSVSVDGRFVLFRSMATDLSTPATGSGTNIFLRDRQSNLTYALTRSGFRAVAMTPDGSWVVVVDQHPSLYVWNSRQGTVLYSNALPLGALAVSLAISKDGSRVAYCGYSSAGAPLNLLDPVAGTNQVLDSDNSIYKEPSFNADCRALVCTKAVGTAVRQVYVYDLLARTNTLVTHIFGSTNAGAGASGSPAISPDGRFVVYRSVATNLVAGSFSGLPMLFLYDRQTGSNTLLSVSQAGTAPNDRSLTPSFSADGQTLFFESWASDLCRGDFNRQCDIFAYSFLYALLLPGTGAGQGPWVSWPWSSNLNYEVQYKDSLLEDIWHPLPGTLTNSAGRAYQQDPTPNSPQRFYRVVSY